MKVHETSIAAVKLIDQFRADDNRGSFVKTFHASLLLEGGIGFKLKESFYSVSSKNVIRGMHFHHPPHDHEKIVFCTDGHILDVALDLRQSEPTYGHYVFAELSFDRHQALYIPKGFAHGFLTLSEQATTFYFVSGEYNRDADDGIRYDSFEFNWPVESPVLSERDLAFKTLGQFSSPF